MWFILMDGIRSLLTALEKTDGLRIEKDTAFLLASNLAKLIH